MHRVGSHCIALASSPCLIRKILNISYRRFCSSLPLSIQNKSQLLFFITFSQKAVQILLKYLQLIAWFSHGPHLPALSGWKIMLPSSDADLTCFRSNSTIVLLNCLDFSLEPSSELPPIFLQIPFSIVPYSLWQSSWNHFAL